MVYQEKLVVCVKTNGKILRDIDNTVEIPFGTEYSILIKNLNTTRAIVSISIDGTDVLYGRSVVVQPNQSTEIERFVQNTSYGQRFKFIERTADIEHHRGIQLDDGLIRVEYRFEKPETLYRSNTTNYPSMWYTHNGVPLVDHRGGDWHNGMTNQHVLCNVTTSSAVASNTAGITTMGSSSQQQFESVVVSALESTSHAIVIKLVGVNKLKMPISKPICVKTKKHCNICGRKYNSHIQYCPRDGTYLTV